MWVIAPKIWTNFGGLFIMKLTDENNQDEQKLKYKKEILNILGL